MRRKALHRILDLSLDINGMQKSDNEFTSGHPTTMFNISGHVARAWVRIYSHGWDENTYSDKCLECYFDNCGFGDNPMRMADKLEKSKEELIKNGIL